MSETKRTETFAGVKERWRTQAAKGRKLYPEHKFVEFDSCADELESGLEQRVRELRDHAATCRLMNGSYFAEALTALLGEEHTP